MNELPPLDSYEVMGLFGWSKVAQALLLLGIVVVGVTCALIMQWRRLRKVCLWVAIIFGLTCSILILVEMATLRKHYAIQLLGSESDMAAAKACRYLRGELGLPEFRHWLADTNQPANTRYYLAVALILKKGTEAGPILEDVAEFREPRFVQSNGLNHKGVIGWPASGHSVFVMLTNANLH